MGIDMDEFNYSLYERKLDMLREYGVTIYTDKNRADYLFMDDQIHYVEDIDDVAEFLNL